MRCTATLACLLALGILHTNARANCGQGVCSVNTDWEAQGTPIDSGARVDVRFEFIDQDQPRAGSRRVSVGEIHRHHDEVRTHNRNWIVGLDYAFNQTWSLTASLPYFDRDHHHIHNHHGARIPERWSYSELGDARLLARYRHSSGEAGQYSWGLVAGVKLPTGQDDVRNDEGELAERTLQPGTGTTDAILGAFYHRALETADLFAQIQLQQATRKKNEFAPGMRSALDIGLRYPLAEKLALHAQLNLLHRKRDRGDEAEPDDSGGRFVYLSSGLSVEVTRALRAYVFVQLPLYQYVNGVQLTEKWAMSAGISARF